MLQGLGIDIDIGIGIDVDTDTYIDIYVYTCMCGLCATTCSSVHCIHYTGSDCIQANLDKSMWRLHG